MYVSLLKCKIHRATVTQAELNYVGSITVDEALMDAAGLLEYEKVQVVNINTGARLETYVIRGECHSGIICLNGAAARHAQPGDKVIIMAYVQMEPHEAAQNPPRVVFVDDANKISKTASYERHGMLSILD